MLRVLEVARGVAIRRAVATAHVTAGQAQAQMYPGAASFQTFFTTGRARWLRLQGADVFA